MSITHLSGILCGVDTKKYGCSGAKLLGMRYEEYQNSLRNIFSESPFSLRPPPPQLDKIRLWLNSPPPLQAYSLAASGSCVSLYVSLTPSFDCWWALLYDFDEIKESKCYCHCYTTLGIITFKAIQQGEFQCTSLF